MKNFGKIGVVKFSDSHASAGSSERIPVWLNRDEEPHTVMSVDPRCHSNSAALDTNDKFTFICAKPRAYVLLLDPLAHGRHDRRRDG